jgi:major vault protein
VGDSSTGVDEVIIKVVNGIVLEDQKTALHLRARRNFTDIYGRARKTGEEWVVTRKDAEIHIPDVCEEEVAISEAIVLKPNNYLTVLDPVGEDGKPQMGQKKIIKGPGYYFMLPGERSSGVQNSEVLFPESGLVVQASQDFEEVDGATRKQRKAGEKWWIYGPKEYFPPPQVLILQRRTARIRLVALGIYAGFTDVSFALIVLLISILLWYFMKWFF